MATVKTSKRRPVAPTKDTQLVNLDTLTKLRTETTVDAYHSLFMNIEFLMVSLNEHGVHDEVITMINSARMAQHVRDVPLLDKYLTEIIASARRFQDENDRASRKAEADLYSPENTVTRLVALSNPKRLRPPEGGAIITLTVTARLSNSLPTSSAVLLKAEQIYGPFWNIKARCFVVPRGESAAQSFVNYTANRPKTRERNWRLLSEYKLVQSTYRNVEIYMLTDLPRLVALRETKILELGLSTREEIKAQDQEDRLPIIEKAELAVSRLPSTVSVESRRYIVYRLVELMLLVDKKTKLRNARYKRDGAPKEHNAASTLLAHQRFQIVINLAEKLGVHTSDIQKALVGRFFSGYEGEFLRKLGREGWLAAQAQMREWQELKKLGEI